MSTHKDGERTSHNVVCCNTRPGICCVMDLYIFSRFGMYVVYTLRNYVGKVPHTSTLNIPGGVYCYKSYGITYIIVSVYL